MHAVRDDVDDGRPPREDDRLPEVGGGEFQGLVEPAFPDDFRDDGLELRRALVQKGEYLVRLPRALLVLGRGPQRAFADPVRPATDARDNVKQRVVKAAWTDVKPLRRRRRRQVAAPPQEQGRRPGVVPKQTVSEPALRCQGPAQVSVLQ